MDKQFAPGKTGGRRQQRKHPSHHSTAERKNNSYLLPSGINSSAAEKGQQILSLSVSENSQGLGKGEGQESLLVSDI